MRAWWILPAMVAMLGCDTRPPAERLADRKTRETRQVQAVQDAVNVVLAKAGQALTDANLPGATPLSVKIAGERMAGLVLDLQAVQIPVLESQALTLKLRDAQRHGVDHLSYGGKAIVIRSRMEALDSVGDKDGARALEVDHSLSAEVAQTSGKLMHDAFTDAWKLVDRPLE